MSTRKMAELQAALEGVSLPASKRELIDYARAEDGARFAPLLARLPDREFDSLDEVAEELRPAQPERTAPDPERPHEESGKPPGGAAYIDASAESGRVREGGP
ncbi:MAG TPA: DUF2795 domain-containing protein [Gaiellaceae bacterium]